MRQRLCVRSQPYDIVYLSAVDIYEAHEVMALPMTVRRASFREETRNGVDVSQLKKLIIGKHVNSLSVGAFRMFKGLRELEFDKDASRGLQADYKRGRRLKNP